MAKARRTVTMAATPARVWELLADPHHMPRWWPGVARMEDVREDRFTQVFVTKKGRPVRVDFHLLASEPPGTDGSGSARRRWEQEIAGTPFQRVLSESITEIVLEPLAGEAGEAGGEAGERLEPARTRITIEQRQRLRGYSRTGGFLLRRATGAKLDEALEGLRRICR
ncbi:MAG: hypothetical protein DLM64_04480 [Solirubrobacterales bacterium]|nr:MAG: hypothetical protein DLM64_04480 [Solirubrobacterales bacterium]